MSTIQFTKNEILKLSLQIKNEEKDAIEGLREIYALWNEAGLLQDENYRVIAAIVDETETIIKGKIQKNFSTNYIKEQEIWEKEYLSDTFPLIEEILEELSKILIIEKSEDLYE